MLPGTNLTLSAAILTALELSLAPTDDDHRQLVERHYTRLADIMAEPNDGRLGNYTSKQMAREQMARMTLMIRDYIQHDRRLRELGDLGQSHEPIESMIFDVIDASLTVQGVCKPWNQSLFINGDLWGREQELAAIMQEQFAESVDDVIELWNIKPCYEKPIPGPEQARTCGEDLGKDINWNRVLVRSRSEANMLHDFRNFEIEDRTQWELELQLRETDFEELDLQWPPLFNDPEPNVGRQSARTTTGTSNVQPSSQVSRSSSKSRRGSRAEIPPMGRPMLSGVPNYDLLLQAHMVPKSHQKQVEKSDRSALLSDSPRHQVWRTSLHSVAGSSDADGETV